MHEGIQTKFNREAIQGIPPSMIYRINYKPLNIVINDKNKKNERTELQVSTLRGSKQITNKHRV